MHATTARLTTAQLDSADEAFNGHDETIAVSVRNMEQLVGNLPAVEREAVTTNIRESYSGAGNPMPSTSSQQSDGGLEKVVELLPPRTPPNLSSTCLALQEWEGFVIEIGDDDFTANLLDLTADAVIADEEAVIPLIEISEIDAAKMQIGSVFRWIIGYQRSVSGTKERVSRIVFRDLPAFTKSEIQAAEEWARQMKEAFEE